MTDALVRRWLIEQHRAGCLLCLVLDSQNERDMRQRWLKSSRYEQYASLYSETAVAELADTGPFLFTFDQPDDRRLDALLDRPDSHWGWLASLGKGELKAWVRHWQERLIIGARPHQALYRFHDNRVLSRALEHLPVEALPAYLGPAISVCHWQGSHWQITDNPAPGSYPVPDTPPWLQLPMPDEQATEIRLANAHRFLLAGHVQAYSALAGVQDPQIWLRERLTQAEAWGWLAPERLEFLLIHSLQTPNLAPHWQARPDETPDEHFDRVYQLSKHWNGGDALMKIPLKSLGLIGCFAALGGCRTELPNTFKFTADLPPGFAYVAAVYYVPEKGQTCTLDRRDNLAPVFNSKWRTDYKPDAEITIRKTVKGCPLVISRIALEINASYYKARGDFGGDEGMVFLGNDIEEQYKGTFNDAGESTFYGQCEWWFRTAGAQRRIVKILDCKTTDAQGERGKGKTYSAFGLDQLPGKTIKMKIKLAADEQPAIRDTWVKTPNGWKRCMGDNFEDQYAFCYGNYTDFSTFTMPDGQVCTIYPGCME